MKLKRYWTILATRIDALSLRERAVLFGTALVLCLLLIDVLWLAPVQARHQQATQRSAAQDAELQRLREELKATDGETGPGRRMREELAQLRERIAAVNQEIAATPRAGADETPLSKVLVHFLRRHEGLVLVRTATLAADLRPGEAGGAQVQRQGLELTVAGSYGELTRYVQTLERALPALRWGTMRLESKSQPAELTLQVWLVGGGA
jgi:MSHA biogenesis protein MshJ